MKKYLAFGVVLLILSSCTEKKKFQVRDIFGNKVEHGSIIQNDKTTEFENSEVEITYPKKGFSQIINVYSTDMYPLILSCSSIDDSIHLSMQFSSIDTIRMIKKIESNQVCIINTKTKSYIPVPEGDFYVDHVKLPFHWEGPVGEDYYYPQTDFIKIRKSEFGGILYSLDKKMQFLKNEGFFLKRVISYMGAPENTVVNAKADFTKIDDNTTLISSSLEPGLYVLVAYGSGIQGSNISSSADKPIYLIEITE